MSVTTHAPVAAPTKTIIQAINEALALEMARDDRVILLGEDIGRLGGVFRATDGLAERFGSDRVVDTPLAEASIIGASVGLAVAGLVPVPELQFLGFGHQAFHQLAQQVARFRSRSQGRFGLPITIRAPYGGGVRTPELHSDAFEALYVHCPGLKVVAPATAEDAKGLLLAAIRDPDPVLFLEPLRGYRLVSDPVPEGDYETPIGLARIARPGTDVSIITYSAAVHVALDAADELESQHAISAEVVDLRTLTPLDVATVVRSVTRTGRAVVVQEAPLTGGFGAELVATIQEEAFYSLEAPVQRVGAPDAPYPLGGCEDLYVPGVHAVVASARAAVGLR